MNKQEVAHEIKTQLDLLYAQVTNNQKNAMSYQDICKITDYLSDVFLKQTGEVPKLISGACDVARGLLNPNKISSMNELRKGFGLLLTTIGGLGLIWGIMVAIGVGVSVWTSIIAFFTGGSFPFLGPLAIAAGLAAIVTGVYVAMTFLSPTDLSARAHDIVVKAIDAWTDPKAAAEADKQAVKHMESETK